MQANSEADSSSEPGADARLCENCGAPLKGPYCYRCGQPTRSFIRALPGLVREIAGETLYYDSRMWRTLKALLFQPGLLSSAYVAGRRARYTPPVRLYLICSILAFLMVGVIIDTSEIGPWQSQIEAEIVDASGPNGQSGLYFGNQPWHAEDNPLTVRGLGEDGNAWLNRQIGRIVDNVAEVQRNPLRFIRNAAGMLPQTMFVLLPLFAAMIALFYLFSGRYYIEHLLLQVHNHSFLFLIIIAQYLLTLAGTRLDAASFGGSAALSGGFSLLNLAIQIWIPVYLFLSLRRFYGQGWLMTSVKFSVLAVSYFFLICFALLGVLVLGLWRL